MFGQADDSLVHFQWLDRVLNVVEDVSFWNAFDVSLLEGGKTMKEIL